MEDNTMLDNDIAIIGFSAKYPGCENIFQFQDAILNGVDLLQGRVIKNEQNEKIIKVNSRFRDIEKFDAEFFGIHPTDAEIMSPQFKMFIEQTWHAFENAGFDPYQGDELLGIFTGSNMSGYLYNHILNNEELCRTTNPLRIITGNEKDYLSSLLAYLFNARGPVLSVQTACSTALSAVHLACESLLSYSCDIAVAGAVTITVPQTDEYAYEEGGLLSKDGKCHTFDNAAIGTVYNDGLGVFILKRAVDAMEQGDTIYALIKGTALNNDGSLRNGFTVPGVTGQKEVIQRALTISGVDVSDIGMVEAHGTGTPLGDAIELQSLNLMYSALTEKKGYCALGSVKTNLGHSGVASGTSSLLKVIVSLVNRKIPPTLNFETPNEYSRLENSPFYINTLLTDWKTTEGKPRYAAINSFGLGGTNVHAILQEAPSQIWSNEKKPWHLLVFSAKSERVLKKMLQQYSQFFHSREDLDIDDVEYTLQVGRHPFQYRCAILVKDINEAAQLCSSMQNQIKVTDLNNVPLFCYLKAELTRTDYHNFRVMKENDMKVAENFELCRKSIEKVCYINIEKALLTCNQLTEQEKNLCTFAIEYCTALDWMNQGITFEGIIAEGVGELVALAILKIYEFEAVIRKIKNNQGKAGIKHDQVTCGKVRVYNKNQISMTEKDETRYIDIEVTSIIDKKSMILVIGSKLDQESNLKRFEEKFILYSFCNREVVFSEIYRHKMASLSVLWENNVDIDWIKHYSGIYRKKIILVEYPFLNTRYWVDRKDIQLTSADTQSFLDNLDITDIKAIVRKVWESQLRVSMSDTMDLLEAGGNSLIALSIVNQINSIYGCEVQIRDLFENPTIVEFYRCVENQLIQRLSDGEFNAILNEVNY